MFCRVESDCIKLMPLTYQLCLEDRKGGKQWCLECAQSYKVAGPDIPLEKAEERPPGPWAGVWAPSLYAPLNTGSFGRRLERTGIFRILTHSRGRLAVATYSDPLQDRKNDVAVVLTILLGRLTAKPKKLDRWRRILAVGIEGGGETEILDKLGVSRRTFYADMKEFFRKLRELKMSPELEAALLAKIARFSPAYLAAAEAAGLTIEEMALDWKDDPNPTWKTPADIDAQLKADSERLGRPIK